MSLSIEECLKIMEECSEEFYKKRDTHSFEDILNLYISDHNMYIKTLSMCKCCERHQQNRPTHSSCEQPEWNLEHDTNIYKNKCTCPCRHYIRTICSAYHNKKRKVDVSSSKGSCFRSQCEFRCNCK